jgi:hypothetical protein
MSSDAKQVYAEARTVVERALDTAGRAQFEGRYPDVHRDRRQLIELRRSVPNDRLDPTNQIVRDLLTTYASVLEEQGSKNAFERDTAISGELKTELERLRPRAARQGLPVLADDLRSFKMGRAAPAPRPQRPQRAATPAAAPAAGGEHAAGSGASAGTGREHGAGSGASAGTGRPRRRRRSRRSGSATPPQR